MEERLRKLEDELREQGRAIRYLQSRVDALEGLETAPVAKYPKWLGSSFRRRLARALMFQWDRENGAVKSLPPIKDLGEVFHLLGEDEETLPLEPSVD